MAVQTQSMPPQRNAEKDMVGFDPLQPIASFWERPFFSTRGGVMVFWGLLLTLAGLRAYIGLSGVRVYAHDAFMVLDGAWRMVNGQRPHLDFNSMIGPAAYLPTVIGFKLCGANVAGFGYGQALVALLAGAWAFALGKGLAAAPRIAFALGVAAIAGSPALVGPTPFALTPGMTYNRYTYALLGLVLLECMQAPQRAEFLGGFSSGAVFGILAFLKMTGVVIEGVLLVGLFPLRAQTARRWWGFLAGFLVTALPFAAYLRFQLGAVWQDLQITAGAKHMVFYDRFDFGSLLFEAAVALLLTWVAVLLLQEQGERRRAWSVLWGVLVTLASSLALLVSNFQHASMPLLTLMLILVADAVIVHVPDLTNLHPMRSLAMTGITIFVGVLGLMTGISFGSGLGLKVFTVRHRPHFESPVLFSFVPVADDIAYTDWVNNGFELLAGNRRPGERVMSLDFTNPFSYGLHLQPAPGGSTNLQFQGSFDDRHKVPPEKLFGGAELVMLPKDFTDPTLYESVPRIYGPYLHQHFRLAAKTGGWQLFRREPEP